MRTRSLILAASWGLGLLFLVAGMVTWLYHPPSARCPVCQRPIHANTHATARVESRQIELCCPQCVLALRQETGKDARFLEVSDFLTAGPLRPETAYYVEGSAVEVCRIPPRSRPGGGTLLERHSEPCAPNLLAFANEKRARAFMAENGGTLKRLKDLLREQPPPTGSTERSGTP